MVHAEDNGALCLYVGDGDAEEWRDRRCTEKAKRDFPGGAVDKNLPAVQGTQVQPLVWEDPTCRGATKPTCHNY